MSQCVGFSYVAMTSSGEQEAANTISSNCVQISPAPSEMKCGYIEHHVSKMDTLAGIAIKYGVEVVDIRRVNGLVTDLQMFAHKTLKIPLLGKHPTTISSTPNSNISSAPPRLGKRIINLPNLSAEISNNSISSSSSSSSFSSLSIRVLKCYSRLFSSTQSAKEGMEMTLCKPVRGQQSESNPTSGQVNGLRNQTNNKISDNNNNKRGRFSALGSLPLLVISKPVSGSWRNKAALD